MFELTGIWVNETLPTRRVHPSAIGKLTVVEKVFGSSLKRLAALRGGAGQCSNSTHLTSSADTVHTFRPSQFFHRRLWLFVSFTLTHLHRVPFPLPLSRSSLVMHM